MFNLSDMKLILNIFVILMFGISLLPKDYAISNLFETDIYRYLRIGVGFILGITVLILANIKKKKVGDKN